MVGNVSHSVVAEARTRYSRAFVVLVTAPLDMLRARLMMRGRNSDIDVAGRLSRALWFGETLCPDHVIVNVGAIDPAAAQLAAVIGAAAGLMLGCAWVGRLKGAKFSSVMAARRPSRTVRVEQAVSPLFDADQLR